MEKTNDAITGQPTAKFAVKQVSLGGPIRTTRVGLVAAGSGGALGLDLSFPPIVPLPIVIENGGGKIAGESLPVQLIFWGAAWNETSTNPSGQAIIEVIQKILSGPYTTALRQYGVRPPVFGDALVVTNPAPPTLPDRFSEGDVNDLIWGLIDNHTFPEPDEAGGLNLYFVIMPPQTRYNPGGGLDAVGAHGPARDVDLGFGVDVDYAWTAWVGNRGLDGMTATFCHELAEMCTDPELDAWKVNGQPDQIAEICDVCNMVDASLHGVKVESYWSQEDNTCLIPTGYSLRRTLKWAHIDLGGRGIRSLQSPIPSLVALIRQL